MLGLGHQGHPADFVAGSLLGEGHLEVGHALFLVLHAVVGEDQAHRHFTAARDLSGRSAGLGVLKNIAVQFLHVVQGLVLSAQADILRPQGGESRSGG